jgi:uroporphyrinogen III methyltransferase / synthase
VAEKFPSSLAGKRIVITRSASQSETLANELSARGAIPIVLPLVSFGDPENFASLDAAIKQAERFDWIIFTSTQAVRAVVARSTVLERPLTKTRNSLRIAAVGPVTAKAAEQAGLLVAYVAKTHNGVALADELGERLRQQKVFLPRSDRANADLPAALKRHGAHVTEVSAYRTLRPNEVEQRNLSRVAAGEADAVLFFSPSAVQHFVESFGGEQLRFLQDKLAITSVGPVTAGALRDAGFERIVTAGETTAAAVVKALEVHFAATVKLSSAGGKRG